MRDGEPPASRGRRLLVTAVLFLLLVTTLLIYRLCYATPGTVVCARAGAGRLHFPHTRRRLPGAIVIGARKAGTRALLEMINVHPLVRLVPLHSHVGRVRSPHTDDWVSLASLRLMDRTLLSFAGPFFLEILTEWLNGRLNEVRALTKRRLLCWP